MTTRTLALLAALLASAPLRAERPPVHAGAPQVSRDGKRVLFASNRDGQLGIYVMEIDGSAVRSLTKSGGFKYAPAWGPRPDEFMYATEHQGKQDWGDVVVAKLDGSSERVLASGPHASWPKASPDGKRVVFRSGLFPAFAVFRVNADGTGVRNLTPDIKSAAEPAWSPDGKRILFIDMETEPADPRKTKSSAIYLMNADGSRKKLLFRLDGVAQRPEWSADGRRIAFQVASTDLKDIQVNVADIPSGNPHSITPHGDGRKLWDETPSWTPDGRLVFGSDRDGRMELYVMNADGSEQRRLTF